MGRLEKKRQRMAAVYAAAYPELFVMDEGKLNFAARDRRNWRTPPLSLESRMYLLDWMHIVGERFLVTSTTITEMQLGRYTTMMSDEYAAYKARKLLLGGYPRG